MSVMRNVLLGVLVVSVGCAGGKPAAEPTEAQAIPVVGAAGGAAGSQSVSVGAPRGREGAPKRALTVAEARRYMVELINRDRKSEGLPPVELDSGPPTAAAQAHADDMATRGYLGHWGTDGSVPEQRLTEAGGADMVLENAACFVDERTRTLDAKPVIDAAEIERTESMFFNETPPNDGHRRNILKPAHRRVGIGVAQPVSTATEIAVPCFAQEFIDPYGAYAPLPRKARLGQVVHVAGTVTSPAAPAGVGVARVETPRPLSPADANKRRSRVTPEPFAMYWPRGYKTPIPVAIDGDRFAIDVPLDDRGAPGLYEVSVWGKMRGSNDIVMLSLRTILVER